MTCRLRASKWLHGEVQRHPRDGLGRRPQPNTVCVKHLTAFPIASRRSPGPASGEGHPLAAPVNRDERNTAHDPASFSSKACIPTRRNRRTTWFSNFGCAIAHQSPIRIKAFAPCGAQPLAALAAPENPLFPTASNSRDRSSRSHRSMASHGCDPTPCGSRYGRNELLGLGGIGGGVQSGLLVSSQPYSDTAAAVPLNLQLLIDVFIQRPSTRRRACRLS